MLACRRCRFLQLALWTLEALALVAIPFTVGGCAASTDITYGTATYHNGKNLNAEGVDITLSDGSHIHFDKLESDAATASRAQADLVKSYGDTVRGLVGDALKLVEASRKPTDTPPPPADGTSADDATRPE